MNQTNNSELLSRAAPLATVALAPNPAPPLPASISALRRLAIPLGGVLLASALIGLTVTRWDSWRSRASVQVTNNAVVRAELTRLS